GRAELDAVRAARGSVRNLGPRDAPDGFWERVGAAVAAASDLHPSATTSSASVAMLDEQRARRRSRRRIAAWAAGGVAAAVVFGSMFVIPGRRDVRPNVAAVVMHHGASSADRSDPLSGLVPLARVRRPR